MMFDSVKRLTEAVCAVLHDCTVYLTGSVCLNDYRHGWSDIDMLFLAAGKVSISVSTVPIRAVCIVSMHKHT